MNAQMVKIVLEYMVKGWLIRLFLVKNISINDVCNSLYVVKIQDLIYKYVYIKRHSVV